MDEHLQAALATNLDGSFESLVLAYQDRLYRFALRLTHDSQEAEEIAQDAFIRCYHALRGYDGDRIAALALRPWLYRITLNVARNRLRRHRPPIEELEEVRDDAIGPEQSAEASERTRILGETLRMLPERVRVPIVLRYVEDLSYGEMAEITGQPEGTLRSTVHRGLRQLRTMLTEEVSA